MTDTKKSWRERNRSDLISLLQLVFVVVILIQIFMQSWIWGIGSLVAMGIVWILFLIWERKILDRDNKDRSQRR